VSQPEFLLEFKRVTHFFYTAYVVSNMGMANLAKEISTMDGFNPEGLFVIGAKDEVTDERMSWAQMGNDDAIAGMVKDGAFSQIIAHGAISWLYALWSEQYRSKIATEIGIKTNNLMCDVMGEIRIIRNLIHHNSAYADSQSIEKLRIFNWIKEGELAFDSEAMKKVQQSINLMQVYERKP